MGSSHSINQTPLGKSLIGKKFMTKDHVCFFYCGIDKTYGVSEWKDGRHLGSEPKVDTIYLEIQSNIKFEIIDVIKTVNINGRHVLIKIKILNNIQMKDIGKIVEHPVVEVEYPMGVYSPTGWVFRNNIRDVRSTMLPHFTQYNLNIADIEGVLYDSDFGLGVHKLSNGDIDENSPYILQGDKLIVI